MILGLKADTKTLLLTELKDLNQGNLPQAPLIANTCYYFCVTILDPSL